MSENNSTRVHSIRSQNSLKPLFIIFVNRSNQNVDLFWIDYNGLEVRYVTMRPGQYFKCKTFCTHPWIFRDTYTKRRLIWKHSSTSLSSDENSCQQIGNYLTYVANDLPQKGYQMVNIYSLFPTLKESCFEIIFKTIHSKHFDSEDIPKCLIDEYDRYIDLFYK